jgi:histidinol-phosphate aminotransferase
MKRFWNPFLSALTPYVPGEQPRVEGLIKLNTNENPYPPSAKAIDAMRCAVDDSLRLYPDPSGTELKRALAHRHGLKTDQVFVGNGSDEVLAFLFQALMGQAGGCAYPAISYSFYPVYCQLFGIESRPFALADDFSIDLSKVAPEAGSLILPNPNAPTGIALPAESILAHARQHRERLVVVDEAYVDFGAMSCVDYIDQVDNLMVVQTLSKSRALAGLRVGFAFASADLIEALERVKNSFNSYTVDRLAMAGAIAAIEDEAWFESNRARVMKNRQALCDSLRSLGFEVLESRANFLFVRHPAHDAAGLAQMLRERKILVRHFAKPGIDQFLRISVGTEDQCAALLGALHNLIAAEAA